MAKDIKVKGFKYLSETLGDYSEGLSRLEAAPTEDEGKVIVRDSNFVDSDMRLVQENRLSQDDSSARHEARYVAARLQKPFSEEDTEEEELKESGDEIVNRFVRDYLDNIFPGD